MNTSFNSKAYNIPTPHSQWETPGTTARMGGWAEGKIKRSPKFLRQKADETIRGIMDKGSGANTLPQEFREAVKQTIAGVLETLTKVPEKAKALNISVTEERQRDISREAKRLEQYASQGNMTNADLRNIIRQIRTIDHILDASDPRIVPVGKINFLLDLLKAHSVTDDEREKFETLIGSVISRYESTAKKESDGLTEKGGGDRSAGGLSLVGLHLLAGSLGPAGMLASQVLTLPFVEEKAREIVGLTKSKLFSFVKRKSSKLVSNLSRTKIGHSLGMSLRLPEHEPEPEIEIPEIGSELLGEDKDKVPGISPGAVAPAPKVEIPEVKGSFAKSILEGVSAELKESNADDTVKNQAQKITYQILSGMENQGDLDDIEKLIRGELSGLPEEKDVERRAHEIVEEIYNSIQENLGALLGDEADAIVGAVELGDKARKGKKPAKKSWRLQAGLTSDINPLADASLGGNRTQGRLMQYKELIRATDGSLVFSMAEGDRKIRDNEIDKWDTRWADYLKFLDDKFTSVISSLKKVEDAAEEGGDVYGGADGGDKDKKKSRKPKRGPKPKQGGVFRRGLGVVKSVGSKALSYGGKLLGGIATPLMAGVTAYSAYNEGVPESEGNAENLPTPVNIEEPMAKDNVPPEKPKGTRQKERTGKAIGAGGGILAGAALGQWLIPIPIVGAIIGSIGGMLLSGVTKDIGGSIGKHLDEKSEETKQEISKDVVATNLADKTAMPLNAKSIMEMRKEVISGKALVSNITTTDLTTDAQVDASGIKNLAHDTAIASAEPEIPINEKFIPVEPNIIVNVPPAPKDNKPSIRQPPSTVGGKRTLPTISDESFVVSELGLILVNGKRM